MPMRKLLEELYESLFYSLTEKEWQSLYQKLSQITSKYPYTNRNDVAIALINYHEIRIETIDHKPLVKIPRVVVSVTDIYYYKKFYNLPVQLQNKIQDTINQIER